MKINRQRPSWASWTLPSEMWEPRPQPEVHAWRLLPGEYPILLDADADADAEPISLQR